MKANSKRNASTLSGNWRGVKSSLISMDKSGLVDLIHAMYDSDAKIKRGLIMRFVPSEKCLTKARKQVVALVYPDPLGSDPILVDEALNGIKTFYAVSGDASSTCEILLDGIEAGTAQAVDLGIEDASYFNDLATMMSMVISLQKGLSRPVRRQMLARVVRIHKLGKTVAFWHGETLTQMLRSMRRLSRQATRG